MMGWGFDFDNPPPPTITTGVRAAMQESDRVAEKGRKRKRILEAVKEVGEAKAQAQVQAEQAEQRCVVARCLSCGWGGVGDGRHGTAWHDLLT